MSRRRARATVSRPRATVSPTRAVPGDRAVLPELAASGDLAAGRRWVVPSRWAVVRDWSVPDRAASGDRAALSDLAVSGDLAAGRQWAAPPIRFVAPGRHVAPGRAVPSTRAVPSGRPALRGRAAAVAGVVLAVALTVAGCGGRPTTHHKPGTSHEEATAGSGTLLAAKDEAGHRLREVPAAGAPAVRVETRPDTEGGWNVHLVVERFRFTPESVGGAALPGRGYARLLVDGGGGAGGPAGGATGRVYGPWHHVPPGTRALTVRLHADDHTVWAVAGKPVEATVSLAAERPGTAAPTAAAPPGVPPTGTTPTPSGATADGRTVEITVSGTSVRPAPSRIELRKGERITLRVTSDRADTLHVHGYDRELPLPAGRPGSLTLTADRTGLFEVETHESGLVLTQLLVR
ncbi:hypothetical protein [Streptomyces sp. NPDC053755]|uniref:hypothetical protein n=1 Tax=Streptomyces sp. NPDC053755 TaxID=3155815 RepID=UPI003446D7EA